MSVRRVLIATVTALSCLDPTEIRVDITTNESCTVVAANAVRVRVGAKDGSTTSTDLRVSSCTVGSGTNHVGTFVVVPSGALDQGVGITLDLNTAGDPTKCDTDVGTCIVAKRALGYIPHRSLDLPIALDTACLGVSCLPNQTCNDGMCVSDIVGDCDGGTCVVSADGGGDAGSCGGIDCSGGVCDPNTGICTLTAMNVPAGPGACIGVTTNAVYFSGGISATGMSNVYSVPSKGGTPQALFPAGASQASGIGTIVGSATAFGAYGNDAYTLTGTPSAVLTAGPYGPVATDGKYVCAAAQSAASFGCTVGGVSNNNGVAAVKIVMDGAFAYLSLIDGTVQRWPYTSTKPTLTNLQTIPNANGLARGSGNTLYVAAGTTIEAVDVTMPFAVPTLAATPFVSARGIAYDANKNTLYVVDNKAGPATIYSVVPVQPPTVIATNQQGADCIAIDATAVYWLAGGRPTKAAR